MSDQPRPVWLTREEIKMSDEDIAGIVEDRWLNAPADARAEIIKALATGRTIDHHIWTRGDAADSVLRALGVPDA